MPSQADLDAALTAVETSTTAAVGAEDSAAIAIPALNQLYKDALAKQPGDTPQAVIDRLTALTRAIDSHTQPLVDAIAANPLPTP